MSAPGSFHLVVIGTPAPAGSKRALPMGGKVGGRPIVVDASSRAKPWKQAIRREAAISMQGQALMEGPLCAKFHFYSRRPKSHFNAKGALKDSAPSWPTTRPDVLKLARAVEDALSGIVYGDDAQIVVEVLTKRYGMPERVEILIVPQKGGSGRYDLTNPRQLDPPRDT